jgi:hypothetical protein
MAITTRRKNVARLIPECAPITRNAPAPAFDSISKRIFGTKKFRGNLADKEREGYESLPAPTRDSLFRFISLLREPRRGRGKK